jgi:phospholipid transport system substrate-binding protein
VGATLFCALSTAQADVIAPDALIKNTVQDVVTIIKQDKEIQSGNERKIAALVDAKVVPHFDFVRMTQLAIGKNWRSATPAQKEALVTGFRNMLVRTYTKVFTVYRDQAIDVKPLKMSADDSEVTVKTTISKPGTQSIPVDYEMKKAADGWKVFDISIEGVSMVLSYRGTFTSQIQQNGIDGLIKTLSDPADDAVKAKAK